MPTKAKNAIPDTMNSMTTYLWFNGQWVDALQFYQQNFGMQLVGKAILSEDKKLLMHAMIELDGSHIMLADAFPNSAEKGAESHTTASIWVYTDNCDQFCQTALDAGCYELMKPEDAFWGDRMGKIKDPFGHCRTIATQQWDLSDDELQTRKQEWLASMNN